MISRKHLENFIIAGLIIAAGAGIRMLPHAWNFAPVTAIAICAAIFLPFSQAIVLPLAIRFVSDLFLGFFSWPLMLAVYLSHLFGVVMGLWVRASVTSSALWAPSPKSEREGVRLGMWLRVIIAPAVSAMVFFLVTNFAWLYPTYAHNLAGIIQSYVNGLPFFRGTFYGDVIFTVAFVGAFEAVKVFAAKKRLASRPSKEFIF